MQRGRLLIVVKQEQHLLVVVLFERVFDEHVHQLVDLLELHRETLHELKSFEFLLVETKIKNIIRPKKYLVTYWHT